MKWIAVSILFVLSFVFAGQAQAASSRCEGCSEPQAKNRAITLGLGQNIVISLSTNKIWVYNVRDLSGGEPNTPVGIVARRVSVPSDIQATFNDAHHFYALSDGTMRVPVSVSVNDLDGVPGLHGATAYDIMTNSNLKAQLGDRLTGSLPGWAALDGAGEKIVQGVFAYIGASDASIEITVVGADGSSVVFKVSVDAGTGEYQDGRSRTKNGQLIPESNSAASQGAWSGVDQPELGNYMGGLGAIIDQVGRGSGYGTFICHWDAPNTRLTCRLQRK